MIAQAQKYFLSLLRSYKELFFDLLIPYKNFFHWFISKVFITIWSIILWIIASLPFYIITVIVVFFSYSSVDWKLLLLSAGSPEILSSLAMGQFLEHPAIIISVIILVVIWSIFFIIWYSYRTILFANLNLSYVEKKKLPVTSNKYFSFKYFVKHLAISFYYVGFTLIPIILFVIWFASLYYLYWGTQIVNSPNMFEEFSYSLLWWFIFCFLIFFYLSFRLVFSSFVLVDHRKNTTPLTWTQSIFKSLSLSRGKFLTCLILLIPFALPIFFIDILWEVIESEGFALYINDTLGEGYATIMFSKLLGTEMIVHLYWFLVFVFIGWYIEMLLASIYDKLILSEKSSNKEVSQPEKQEWETKTTTKKVVKKPTITKPKKKPTTPKKATKSTTKKETKTEKKVSPKKKRAPKKTKKKV